MSVVKENTVAVPLHYIKIQFFAIYPILPGIWKDVVTWGGPLWPPLIFCFLGHQKVVLTPKTCSKINFLIFRHPFTPLFQHSRESVPLFLSVNVNQYLHIETLKIGKTPKGPPFETKKIFCLRFCSNFFCEIL